MNRSPRVRMLASVRSAEEALFALQAGADLIDAKEPFDGVLGAVPPEVLRAIVSAVGGRRPVSATVGDLPLEPKRLLPAIQGNAECGADIVKIGLFEQPFVAGGLRTLAAATAVPLVAVLFADRSPPRHSAIELAAAGWHGVMLDTADKGAGSLRDWTDEVWLAEFVNEARAAGLLVGLAGSLREDDVRPLAALGPDYLGFRGALCAGSD
ncbi:MAG: (5-formylfuran-3-yl)methyl phosphate synthase, partial [Burkholderiaceae bacterium]|nr:(5-formylfuran-3-yl)methyl phosphate synthase [Burkholderiaceae bacterium]